MIELPQFLLSSPEQEVREAALDCVVFALLEADAQARMENEYYDSPPLRAYLLLDASQSADIPICLQGFSNLATCLFDGDAFENLSDVAPWLVEVTRYSDVWDWFVEEGYGKNWGMIIHSRLPMPRLKTQLKKFLKLTDIDGDRYYFKFYRPKHFNIYIPDFNQERQISFMRGIDAIYVESQYEQNNIVQYTKNMDGAIKCRDIDLVKVGEPLVLKVSSKDDAEKIINMIENI